MIELEIVSVKCEQCEQMVSAHDGQEHPCWQDEQDMQVLEEAMWEEYQNGRSQPSEEEEPCTGFSEMTTPE